MVLSNLTIALLLAFGAPAASPRLRPGGGAPTVVVRTQPDVVVGRSVSFGDGRFRVVGGAHEVVVKERDLVHVVIMPRLEALRGRPLVVGLALAVADAERFKRRMSGRRGDPAAALRVYKQIFLLSADNVREVFPRFARKLSNPVHLAILCWELAQGRGTRTDAQTASALLTQAEQAATLTENKFVLALMRVALTIRERGQKEGHRALASLRKQYPTHAPDARMFESMLFRDMRRSPRRPPGGRKPQ